MSTGIWRWRWWSIHFTIYTNHLPFSRSPSPVVLLLLCSLSRQQTRKNLHCPKSRAESRFSQLWIWFDIHFVFTCWDEEEEEREACLQLTAPIPCWMNQEENEKERERQREQIKRRVHSRSIGRSVGRPVSLFPYRIAHFSIRPSTRLLVRLSIKSNRSDSYPFSSRPLYS